MHSWMNPPAPHAEWKKQGTKEPQLHEKSKLAYNGRHQLCGFSGQNEGHGLSRATWQPVEVLEASYIWPAELVYTFVKTSVCTDEMGVFLFVNCT